MAKDIRFRNPLALSAYVREIAENRSEEFYLFIDEIQMSDQVLNPYNKDGKKITFYDASMTCAACQIWILCDRKQFPYAFQRYSDGVSGKKR